MRDPAKTARIVRGVNAAAAAVVTVAFLGHALVAALEAQAAGAGRALDAPFALLACFAVVVLVHVDLSVATTAFMLTDTVWPPSYRKKRHQALKWVTGAVLLAAMGAHVFHVQPQFTGSVSIVLVLALAWHGWTGMKSLARDLDLPGNAKVPLRIALCAVCAVAVALLVASML